ncbi:hypothetical protein MTO96_048698 [Rhipicephalus appendiculatus]
MPSTKFLPLLPVALVPFYATLLFKAAHHKAPLVRLTFEEEYDYIVGRLPNIFLDVPLLAAEIQQTKFDWAYLTVPQEAACFGLKNRELIDGLRDKDSALAKLDKHIADTLDGEELYEETVGALNYHEKIVKSVSRPRCALSTRATVVPTVIEANQLSHAGTSDGYSSNNFMGAAH